MTVRITTRPSDVVWDVSAENLQITKVLNGEEKNFVYGDSSNLANIQNELELLAKHHPGVFRLLWMYVAPWAEISEIFVYYAQMYGITL